MRGNLYFALFVLVAGYVCYTSFRVHVILFYRIVSYRIVTMTSKVIGNTGNLIPCRSETPEILLQKLDTIITLRGSTSVPNFMGIALGVSAGQIAKI